MSGNRDFEMTEYHKIQTAFLRNPATQYKTLLEGQWALPEFEYLADNEWVWTEKIDGTNIRVIFNPEVGIEFRGKTDAATIPTFLYETLADLFGDAQLANLFGTSVVLYGEGYGAKIQKDGALYRPNASFILFDVKIGDNWAPRDRVDMYAHDLGIQSVPVVGRGRLWDAIQYVRSGFTSLVAQSDMIAEGLVMRPAVELLDRRGQRVITKVKHGDFRFVGAKG